jgi:two-component system response regulator DctR
MTEVHLIDDDDQLAAALTTLLQHEGHHVKRFKSGEDFVSYAAAIDPTDKTPACILLDLNLGAGKNGLETFRDLLSQAVHELPPVIFLTGHGDLQTGVEAIKLGAFDFLTKPAASEDLLEKIKKAHTAYKTRLESVLSLAEFRSELEKLTPRQSEVLDLLLRGHTNKEIAEQLGASVRTIEIHRAAVSEKLGGLSFVEIAQLMERSRLIG